MISSTLLQFFHQYRQDHHALPAFNIDCFLTYQAVEQAVLQTRLPALVQLSASQDKFIQAERLFILVKKAQADGLPVFINMDHGRDVNRLLSLARLGFDMLHFDASSMDLPTNISVTSHFISQIKAIRPNCLIEAEFNHINLVDQKIDPSSGGAGPQSFTQPRAAADFISHTRADLLAVSVGNLHGVSTTRPEIIDLDLLSGIQTAIPDTLLVMHGGSGLDPSQLALAIKTGIIKININTDLRLALKPSLTQSLAATSSQKAYDYLAPGLDALTQIAVSKLKQFQN